MRIAMPGPTDNKPRDEIYRNLVAALPEEARTIDVVLTIAMLLSAILIEHAKNAKARVELAKTVCKKIIEACECVPSHDELAAGVKPQIPDKYQTRH